LISSLLVRIGPEIGTATRLVKTPMTLSATFCTRTSLPSGDSSPNNSRTIVWPNRQTLVPLRTSRSVTAVPMLRRRARAWLQARGVDEDVAEAVLLATGEAVSNAVEHAYLPDAEGVVELTMTAGAAEQPTAVHVSVTDGGCWRPAPADWLPRPGAADDPRPRRAGRDQHRVARHVRAHVLALTARLRVS